MESSTITVSSRSWHPLVDGPAADQILSVVTNVAEALDVRGDALALFLDTYLALEQDSERLANRALRGLEAALENDQLHAMPALYGGLAGVGFTLEHVTTALAHFMDQDDADPCVEFDRALLRKAESSSLESSYDLIYGTAGIATYAIERLRRVGSDSGLCKQLLHVIVDRMCDSSVSDARGRTWLTPPSEISSVQRPAYPTGYYNLGVAHGMPAVAVVLAHAVSLDINGGKAMTVLEGAMNWMLAQQEATGAGARMPSWISPEGPTSTRREEAWCYGGLGLSVALLRASQLVGGCWDQAIVQLARLEAMREPATTCDAGLCHGFAGTAHLFNRLYQATGEPVFMEAAKVRIAQALASYDPADTPTGFRFVFAESDGTQRLLPSHGFLVGSAGVLLGLLAAVSRTPPSWDRVMLADLSPGSSVMMPASGLS